MRRKRTSIFWLAAFSILAGFLLGLWIGYRLLPGVGTASAAEMSPAEQDRYVALVAIDYAQTGDLDKAIARLDIIDAPNNGQLVAGVAERAIAAGHSRLEIGALTLLAWDLGVVEEQLRPYLATATPTPLPLTNTPENIPPTPTSIPPTATPEPPTLTPEPPTPTPVPEADTPTPTLTPTPAPLALAGSTINVRGGPGVAYPVVGALDSGASVSIVGRTENGAWWQIDQGGGAIGWVANQVVETAGDTNSVAVITDVAPPPPTPTPSTPPTPTPPPKPAVDYVVKSLRLRPVGKDSQRCDAGDHNIFVTVVDPAGNPLDGVRVREIFTGSIHATGSQGKGSGKSEWDIYRGGGGSMDIVDENGNRISEVTRGMSADWPPIDLMWDAGYCNCKPHPDIESCRSDLESKRYFFAVGHYVYEVVFQRTY